MRKAWHKGKSLNFSHLICDSYQAKINRSFLICEKFPSLLYLLVFFPIFQDRVTAILCHDSRKCHRSESLLVRGLEISPKSSSAKFTQTQWPEVVQIVRS